MYSMCVRLLVLFSFALSGCAALEAMKNGTRSKRSANDSELIDVVGNEVSPVAAKKLKVKVSRAKLQKMLDLGGDLNKARLVEVYRRNQPAGDATEFRILDIGDHSVYSMLGLKSQDVLVAANNFSIPSQAGFWHYLNQIPRLKKASLYIRRSGVPILMQYKLTS